MNLSIVSMMFAQNSDNSFIESGPDAIWITIPFLDGSNDLISLVALILVIAGLWKMFTKAGKPGWAAIIPIYNVIVLFEIAGRPIWWIIWLLVPVVNLVVMFIVLLDVARKFGKGTGTALGLLFLPFFFFFSLGFGSAQYRPDA